MHFCVIARRRLAVTFCVLMAFCLSSTISQAQLPQTRLYAVYPQGAQAGQTVDVTAANGVDLDELDRMTFSHPGIKAAHKTGNAFAVTVAADVPPGVYEARVHGMYGTSNPRCFVVGALPEVLEVDANNTTETAQPVEIGSVVNGRSNRGADVDFYKIKGKKGQRLLIECQALRIDSKFQAELRIYLTPADTRPGSGYHPAGRRRLLSSGHGFCLRRQQRPRVSIEDSFGSAY